MTVLTAELLFAEFGSVVVLLMVAVFVLVLPDGAVGLTLNVNWNEAVAPEANEARVQVIAPVPPTGGKVQVKAGPVF